MYVSVANYLMNFKTLNFPAFFLAGYPVVNDPLYNHEVFGPQKGKGGLIGKSDEQLIQDLISIHNAENWLGKNFTVLPTHSVEKWKKLVTYLANTLFSQSFCKKKTFFSFFKKKW